MAKINFYPGIPSPLGATQLSPSRFRFSLYSSQATEVVLVLADQQGQIYELPLSADKNRTGNIWHIEITGIADTWSYAFRINGPGQIGASFNFEKYIADPYAKNLHTPQTFGASKTQGDYAFSYLKNEEFSWDGDAPLNIPREISVIYEMHVRSFTYDASSKVNHPGTFLGIIEKIDYLKQLGITAIELLPIFEFDETAHPFKSSSSLPLYNYWGYAPVNFFCPCRRYAYASDPCAPQREFKTLVKELHKAGIEVILDVVFNHTGLEGTECPLPWIDLSSYYMLDSEGRHVNYSGCGNTINANHTPTKQWILDILRYWVEEMHVDGFRFDLASALSRDPFGSPLPIAPVLKDIAYDPLLANTKLIAEPWDAAGLYQLGMFPTISPRWSEWNGSYRDTVKAFLNGSPNLIGLFASKISGSQDNYPKGSPCNSVNYISAHDGFTLYDTVSYNEKHNEANGEKNSDGTNANFSYNFGIEGPTNDPKILQAREQQVKNFFLILILSQGIPMIQSGDEYGHTGQGNNNRWSLDNQANYFLWDKLKERSSLFSFVKELLNFRKAHQTIFNKGFLTTETITWLDSEANPISWQPSKFLAYELKDEQHSIYIAISTQEEEITIKLPKPRAGFTNYKKVADTSKGFIEENLEEMTQLEARTILVAISDAIRT
ncbi:isoamylase family protein [Chlamydia ibidis]|uniref:Isoamylase family protein n=2 Tax=Chlamydia ibidis TaxID=1405396 RepID=S7J5T9_9CHLA|nr:isoamylase [Chlamydia ibidis]EPP35618.1 isoamylase family protein [Chlamydia ibidis]EQM62705.1 putative glycosyl hydrolase [Chlamydia ibidis 10-1398/6]